MTDGTVFYLGAVAGLALLTVLEHLWKKRRP